MRELPLIFRVSKDSLAEVLRSKGARIARLQSIVLPLAAALVVMAVAFDAQAGSLPWDRGLVEIGNTLTGKVMAAVGVIGIGIMGASHAANADMGGGARSTVGIIVILGIVLGAKQLVNSMGLNGALLP